MKVALIGGHLSPALAVIDALPPGTQIIFFGRRYGFVSDLTETLEYKIISVMHIPFVSVETSKLQRNASVASFLSLRKLPLGFWQAYNVLRKEKPDVLVGFGGYVSLPVALAGATLKIPLVLHEQTFAVGLANKLLTSFAQKICISWPESAAYFPKNKTVLTGNPLRKEFLQEIDKKKKKNTVPLLLVTGGSSGSHAINTLIEQNLSELLSVCEIIHQTGDAKEFTDYARLDEQRKSLPASLAERYTLQKFIDPVHMLSFMHKADLVIGRSGVNTVTELLALGKPALLIPLPHGQKGEQLQNASVVKKIGIGEVLDQETTSPEQFLTSVKKMFDTLDIYESRAQQAKTHIIPNASEKIIATLQAVAKKDAESEPAETVVDSQ